MLKLQEEEDFDFIGFRFHACIFFFIQLILTGSILHFGAFYTPPPPLVQVVVPEMGVVGQIEYSSPVPGQLRVYGGEEKSVCDGPPCCLVSSLLPSVQAVLHPRLFQAPVLHQARPHCSAPRSPR